MPEGIGYTQEGFPLAEEDELKQLNDLDKQISAARKELATLNSAMGGNFKSMASLLGKNKDGSSPDARNVDRKDFADKARERRVLIEQNLAGMERQRNGQVEGLRNRRLVKAEAAFKALPPLDQQEVAAAKQDPGKARQKFADLQASLSALSQAPGAQPQDVIGAAIELRKLGAVLDSLEGLGTIPDMAAELDGSKKKQGPGPMEKQAGQFIQAAVPRTLSAFSAPQAQPAAVPGGGPLEVGGTIQAGSFDKAPPPGTEPAPRQDPQFMIQGAMPNDPPFPQQYGYIGGGPDQQREDAMRQATADSIRASAPMPELVRAPPGVGLADHLQSFAGRGRGGMAAPAGSQLVFKSGPAGEIQAGSAPIGAAATQQFGAQFQRSPELEQRMNQAPVGTAAPGQPDQTPVPPGTYESLELAPPPPLPAPAVLGSSQIPRSGLEYLSQRQTSSFGPSSLGQPSPQASPSLSPTPTPTPAPQAGGAVRVLDKRTGRTGVLQLAPGEQVDPNFYQVLGG